MNLSELIVLLEKHKKELGDIDVAIMHVMPHAIRGVMSVEYTCEEHGNHAFCFIATEVGIAMLDHRTAESEAERFIARCMKGV